MLCFKMIIEPLLVTVLLVVVSPSAEDHQDGSVMDYPDVMMSPSVCPNILILGLNVTCKTLKDCSVWFFEIAMTTNDAALCKLADGSHGVCCPDIPSNARSAGTLKTIVNAAVNIQPETGDRFFQRFSIYVNRFDDELMTDVFNDSCPIPDPICVSKFNSTFRTFDGTCNNLLHPSWGSAGSPVQRYLPPNYSDGIWKPRVSESDQPLPRYINIDF